MTNEFASLQLSPPRQPLHHGKPFIPRLPSIPPHQLLHNSLQAHIHKYPILHPGPPPAFYPLPRQLPLHPIPIPTPQPDPTLLLPSQ